MPSLAFSVYVHRGDATDSTAKVKAPPELTKSYCWIVALSARNSQGRSQEQRQRMSGWIWINPHLGPHLAYLFWSTSQLQKTYVVWLENNVWRVWKGAWSDFCRRREEVAEDSSVWKTGASTGTRGRLIQSWTVWRKSTGSNYPIISHNKKPRRHPVTFQG